MSPCRRLLPAIFRSCLSLAVLSIAGCGGVPSVIPSAALQTQLDTQVAASQVPGAILGVSKAESQWIGVAGLADTATHAGTQSEQRFRVGSLTKQFTAALILRLAEEGKLSLDDTVQDWLPSLHVPVACTL